MIFPFFRILQTKWSIWWTYRRFFYLLRKTLLLGRRMIVSERIPWDDSSYFKKTLVFILTKNIKTLQAIEILCKNGFGQDALLLLRSMLESVISLGYIILDKENRGQLYLEYGDFLKLKSGKVLLRTNSGVDKTRIQARVQELEREWDSIKHKFLNREGEVCPTWSCKNLREMAIKANLLSVYEWTYPLCSSYAHTTSSIAYSYVLGIDKKGVVLEVGTSHQFIGAVLPTATSLLIYILNFVDSEFNSGFGSGIEKLKENLQSLHVITF